MRNRRDGGVEAVVAGPAEDVDAFIDRAREGPPASRVDMVKVLDETGDPSPGFEVRDTV